MMKATTCLILGLALAAGAAIGESAAERAHGLVPRGALRDVHPLGALFGAGRRMEGKKVGSNVEWIQSHAQIPVAEYTPLKDRSTR
jgi:hypothetical protein